MKAGVFGLSLHGETALGEIGFFTPPPASKAGAV